MHEYYNLKDVYMKLSKSLKTQLDSIKVMKREDKGNEIVDFDYTLIYNAISKSNDSITNTKFKITKKKLDSIITTILEKIVDVDNNAISESKTINDKTYGIVKVEDIQDVVENTLLDDIECRHVGLAYVRYRGYRARIREGEDLTKMMLDVKGKLVCIDDDRQNANIDGKSFGGKIGAATDVLMKKIALDSIMSKKARESHLNNHRYKHDANAYAAGMHNCLSIPFDDQFKNGFNTRQTDIRSPNCINTEGQLFAVLFQIQSLQQFGGCSATHIDSSFIYGIRKSYKKAIELVNTMSFLPKFLHTDVSEVIDPENVSIDDPVYRGKHWYNFAKRAIAKKADNYVIKEMNQTCEALYHNLNSLQSRSGNQLPFTSINYGLATSKEGRMAIDSLLLASQKGTGKLGITSIFPCGVFQYKKGVNDSRNTPNYDMLIKALKSTAKRFYPSYFNCDWSVQVNGIKKDRKLKNDVLAKLYANAIELNSEINEGYTIDTLLRKLTIIFKAHPDYAKAINLEVVNDMIVVDNVNVNPTEEGSTMGCRTYNGYDVNFDEDYFLKLLIEIAKTGKLPNNYLFSAMQKDGRGNICPETIILPEVAMDAKIATKDNPEKIWDKFIELLTIEIEETKNELIERYEFICSQPVDSAKFMYENNMMKGYTPEEGIRSALKHGTLAVGQLGLAECLQILFGYDHTTEKGMYYAEEIEKLFKTKCDEYKTQYKLNFGVYMTPAENLCYTAWKAFVAKYGLIENVTAYKDENGELQPRKYFTNSIHVPVWYKIDPFNKIRIESRLAKYSSAGCITYVEIEYGSLNIRGMYQILEFAMKNDIPYFSFNISMDTCLECGFNDEHDLFTNDECPKCESKKIFKPRKVTGYITGNYVTAFNDGKKAETDDRIKQTKYLKPEDLVWLTR